MKDVDMVLVMICLFCAAMIGCAEEKVDPAAIVATIPPNGSALQTDGSITVVFDGIPGNVAVTAGTAKTDGHTVTISGPFKAGPLNLAITWSDGAHVLNYTVPAEKADLPRLLP